MKKRKITAKTERQVVTGMIVSKRFLQEVQPVYNWDAFESRFGRTIAKWCQTYYEQYEDAPGMHVQDIFNAKKKKLDDDLSDMIADFLYGLSEQFDEDGLNIDYLLDQAEDWFRSRSLKVLASEVAVAVDEGMSIEAEAKIANYAKVSRPEGSDVDPFKDKEAIHNAFERAEEQLFTFPGQLGRMINGQLTRDSLVALMGPEKRGKTWWLMEFAIRAAKARRNVVFFQVGDMSDDQMIRRISIRLAGRSNKAKFCGRLHKPIKDCQHNQDNSCTLKCRTNQIGVMDENGEILPLEEAPVKYNPCTACVGQFPCNFRGAVWHEVRDPVKPLTWQEAVKINARFGRRLKGRHFKQKTYANSSINVSGLVDQLDIWERFEDFIPDVIIIDYADILAEEKASKEFRHGQNETWKALRRLGQERKCLVITATQADAKSYNQKTMSMQNFSEDKRKFAHVTCMLGLNQTREEKQDGLMRINQIVVRDDDFDVARTTTVLQCLPMGRCCLTSY